MTDLHLYRSGHPRKTTRPPAYARRYLRRAYPGAVALLAAWGDDDAIAATTITEPGGRPCTPAGACHV